MKLNDIKLNEDRWFGDYGSAVMQNLSNKLARSGEGSMSTLDRMTKDQYINNFVGLASTTLQSAIDSTRVDPKAAVTPTAQSNTTQTVTPPTSQQEPSVPKTPEQIRKEKQATAAKTAQSQMSSNVVPQQASATTPKTPEQLRKEKQATAANTAQQQMAPFNKLPANQVAVQSQNIRQNKQATAANNAQQQMAPFSKTEPYPQVWKNNRNPQATAKRSPVVKEGSYTKLDSIFESIIMEAGMSISNFMQNFVKKQLQGLNLSTAQAKIKELSDKVQADFQKDGGKAAITQLANLAYTLEHTSGDDAEQTTATEPTANKNSFATGFDQALGAKTVAAKSTPSNTSDFTSAMKQGQSSVAVPSEKEKSVYMQVKGMLDKLDKKGKQRILSTLEKQLGVTPSSATQADPGANAFAQMGKQITQPGVTSTAPATKTSTGGKVQQTGLGQVHTKSRNNPNITRRTKTVAPTTTAQPAWTGRKAKAPAQPTVTTESKRVIKVWGQK